MSSEKFLYGSFRGRGRGGGRGDRNDRGGRGGHPPWLKGKEIGLYYRDKAKRNNHRNEITSNTVKLDIEIERRIRSLIDFKSYAYKRQTSTADNRFDNMYTHITDSQFKEKFLRIISGNIQENLVKSILTKSKLKKNQLLDENLLQEHLKMVSSKQYMSMLKFRSKLPAYNKQEEILNLLKQHQVIVISGETGTYNTMETDYPGLKKIAQVYLNINLSVKQLKIND